MSSITAVNPNAPVPADLGTPFSAALSQYYGSLSLGQQQSILLNFMANNNLTLLDLEGPLLTAPVAPNPSSPTYATDIVTYQNALLAYNKQQKNLQRFTEYLKTALNPYEPVPPPVGTTDLGNIMSAYVGMLSPAEQQKIWVDFLAANNLTAAYNGGTLTDSVANQQLLLTYLQAQIAIGAINIPISTNETFSTEEIKKRAIMFSVFNTCISMLLQLQSTVSTQSQNLNFLAQWQQQYTNMLSKMPTYVGGESSGVNENVSDLSKFTFGYSGISVQDIARWWAGIGYNGSQTFEIAQNAPPLFANSPDNIIPTSLPSRLTFASSSITFVTGASIAYTSFSLPINTAGTTFDQRVANFETAFVQFWQTYKPFIQNFSGLGAQAYLNGLAKIDQTLGFNEGTTNATQLGLLAQQQIFSQAHTVNDPYAAIEILKPYTYVAPATDTSTASTLHNLSDANAKARAEINSRDQQYIQNASTNRQTIQNTSQQAQTSLGQSQQELSQQTDLITAIVTSLQGILSSIFR